MKKLKDRATYKDMASSAKEDWDIISGYARDFNQNLSYRIQSSELLDDHGGFSGIDLSIVYNWLPAYKDNERYMLYVH